MLSAQVHSCVVASRKAHTIGTIWTACKYYAYPVMMKFMLLGHKQTLAEPRVSSCETDKTHCGLC